MPAALESSKAQLTTLWEALVPDAVRCVRKNLKETVGTVDSNLVCSFFNVMDALLLPFQRSAQPLLQIVLIAADVHLQCDLGNDMLLVVCKDCSGAAIAQPSSSCDDKQGSVHKHDTTLSSLVIHHVVLVQERG